MLTRDVPHHFLGSVQPSGEPVQSQAFWCQQAHHDLFLSACRFALFYRRFLKKPRIAPTSNLIVRIVKTSVQNLMIEFITTHPKEPLVSRVRTLPETVALYVCQE